jgi:hypothetical protein
LVDCYSHTSLTSSALTAVVTQTAVKPKIRVEVTCEAPDLESTANFFVTNWIAIKFQAPHGRRSEMFEFIGYRAFGFCSALPSVCTENFIRID